MIARACIGILSFEVIGAAMLTLICTDLRRWGLSAKLGLSFGLGLFTLTTVLFAASLFGIVPEWWIGSTLAVLLWVMVAILKRKQLSAWIPSTNKGTANTVSPRSRWIKAGLIGGLTCLCVVVGAVSVLEPVVEWDVLAIWLIKAKVLYHEPLSQTAHFTDISKAYSHLEYPLLWPMAMTWTWKIVGQTDLETVKLLAPAILIAFALTFFGVLKRRGGDVFALMFTALLIGQPYLLSQSARLLSDVPLAFFAATAVACWYAWLEKKHDDDLRLAGIFAAGMLFTKNEGLALFGIVAVITVLALVWQRQFKELLRAGFWMGVVPIALCLGWFYFLQGIPKIGGETSVHGRLNPIIFVQSLDRLPETLLGFLNWFSSTEEWLLFWPLFGLGMVITIRSWIKPPLLFLFLAAVVPFMLYSFVFVCMTLEVNLLMEQTAPRLILQSLPLCVLFLAESVHRAQLLPNITGLVQKNSTT